MITGTAFGQHDLGWLRRHLPEDGGVLINDLTSGRVCFALWGPRARDILAPLTRDDLSDAGFPYLTARAITVGSVPVYALRVTYVGELGWELYAHTEFGRALWRTLWDAGPAPRHGRRGLPRHRCAAAREGLPRLVERHHPRRDAVRGRARVRGGDGQGAPSSSGATRWSPRAPPGPRKRLRCLVLDDPRSVCLGNEPVRLGGEIAGRVTSGGYGFAVERSIAYAYLPPDRAAIGTRGEVEVFGEWVGFEVAREPLYDPEGARIRA